MKKRILILTFADHLTDAQVEAIAQTHRNATGLYSGAVMKSAYMPGADHVILPKGGGKSITTELLRDLITDKPVFESQDDKPVYESDPVAKMGKHFAPDVWAKIVKNYDPEYSYCDLKTACEIESDPSDFIMNAFDWHESPEKYDYWDRIHDSF